jgi:hypothetical protein
MFSQVRPSYDGIHKNVMENPIVENTPNAMQIDYELVTIRKCRRVTFKLAFLTNPPSAIGAKRKRGLQCKFLAVL